MLGGLAPLPIRLGGGNVDGWSAAQHARVCADVVAAVRTCAFAWVTYTPSAGMVTIDSYNGMNGVGLANAPTATYMGTGDVELAWEQSYADQYLAPEPVNLRHADPGVHGSTAARASVVSVGRNKVRIATSTKSPDAAADMKVTVAVY